MVLLSFFLRRTLNDKYIFNYSFFYCILVFNTSYCKDNSENRNNIETISLYDEKETIYILVGRLAENQWEIETC